MLVDNSSLSPVLLASSEPSEPARKARLPVSEDRRPRTPRRPNLHNLGIWEAVTGAEDGGTPLYLTVKPETFSLVTLAKGQRLARQLHLHCLLCVLRLVIHRQYAMM